jgi:Putative zinc-finger
MNDCEGVRDLLVLHAEGGLSPEDNRRVDDHIRVCPLCRAEAAKIDTVTSWLKDPDLFMTHDYAWHSLAPTLAARARELNTGWIPSNLPSLMWAACVAASLLLGCGLIWMLHRPAPAPPPLAHKAGSGNEAFLRQIESVHAREATARYLAECEVLLLNIVGAEKNCEGEKHDVSAEVARARELLQRKHILDVELRAPEVARAKNLCDQLETFLVNLSLSERCETSEGIHTMERFIEREQLLLRIDLLQAELS